MTLKAKIQTLLKKVEETLEEYPATRDCDIELTTKIWTQYYYDCIYRDKDDRYFVYLEKVKDLPREDAISRCRRVIQNDEKKFPPTSLKVAKARGWSEHEWKVALGYRMESPGQKNFGFEGG